MWFFARWFCVTSLVVALSMAAWASPTDPVEITPAPEGGGGAFVPGVREVTELRPGYVEQEFFVSGSATLFNYASETPNGPADIVPIEENLPYQTRMIVRRPPSSEGFDGTVVIEWWNSTAGFDSAPVWDVSAEYFAREGIVYVGVTNSTTAIDFLADGCRIFGVLPPSCEERYETLSLPENGLAYEMMSQIAHRLKSNEPGGPLPAGFEVERIYHAGQSQQGGSVITYASAFHFDANAGYFVQQAATARPINFGPPCGRDGSEPYPDCTPRLEGADALVRTDLPVPVVHAVSETDIEALFGPHGRQPDTPTFRYYEVAGGSHLTVHDGVEVLPAGLVGPEALSLEDLCQFPINSTADGPVFVSYVFNAMWENLERQVRAGKRRKNGRWRRRPPAGVTMETGLAGEVLRDSFGNGLGGVRLPALDAPTATYTPGNSADPQLPPFLQGIGQLSCRLASSVQPLDAETLGALYKNKGRYLRKVKRSARRLAKKGFLLREDRDALLDDAIISATGCDLDVGTFAVLDPALWSRTSRACRSSR